MHPLHDDFAAGLFDVSEPPCISIYQPTHRSYPDNQQDPIRFRNLLREAESSLQEGYPADQVEALLQPFLSLAEDQEFWNRSLDGLAVLAATGLFRVYRLQRGVPELAVVADSFHMKPLLRILQSGDRYQLLGVSRDEIRLFEGNRDELDEVELSPDVPRTAAEALGEPDTQKQQRVASFSGRRTAPAWHGYGDGKDDVGTDAERFFRAADRAITEEHSKPSKLLLLLVGLGENQAIFRRVSRNSWLLPEGIEADPAALSRDELLARAWGVIEHRYLARLEGLVNRFREAHGTGLGIGDPEAAARAAVAGRIDVLLVEAERQLPGRIDAAGAVQWADLSHPGVDDVLDDIAELTLRKRGEVVVVPAERMPTETGLAAICRY